MPDPAWEARVRAEDAASRPPVPHTSGYAETLPDLAVARARLRERIDQETRDGITGTAHRWVRVRLDDLVVVLGDTEGECR